MKVSLNLVKKYVDLPEHLTNAQIAYDLTLRTVEVEGIENVKEKFHDIVVGKILEVKNHSNADLLKVCMVDIGENSPVQIVCGGSNLYEGELVVVSKPGAEVVWHGEGEPVKIKETKMRGESSYGMICGAEEVFLSDFFSPQSEKEIVDLSKLSCQPGDNIADIIFMDDTILEIDNKSLTNRPDLWGHYGIARELSVIYDVPLKKIPSIDIDKKLKSYNVLIEETEKCKRYVAVELDNVEVKESPLWLKSALIKCGMRPINAIVDITNYVMILIGQPTHAFDKSHILGEQIIVRNAKKGEKLLLLDDNTIELTEDDLVICDKESVLALAGIKGGKKDSILATTTDIVLEIANFSASTIRKSGKRFNEKTDAAIRYEKNIDTERVLEGVNVSLALFQEIFPESKIVSYKDNYPSKTKRAEIEVPKDFLDKRLGKVLDDEIIRKILGNLGYEVDFKDNIYHVIAPIWRSTGDVSIKDDVMGDIARILSYDSFDAVPLNVEFEHAVLQNKIILEKRIKEYLAYRCGFNEIFTYPWIEEKYILAARIDVDNSIKLTTPPAPDLAILRSSLVPGMLEAIAKNLRYYDEFKIFEMAQVFEKGEYHESSEDEILPIHKKYLTGCLVGKNAQSIFLEVKGVLDSMAKYCHMKDLTFAVKEKPLWADRYGYLNILYDKKVIGSMGLVSFAVMNEVKIKHTNVVMFELNFDEFKYFDSRTNEFKHLAEFPLVEKDLSLIVDKKITWQEIVDIINGKVKEVIFGEEYLGEQIPEGKKSISFRVRFGKDDRTMTTEEITEKIKQIVDLLSKKCGAILREE